MSKFDDVQMRLTVTTPDLQWWTGERTEWWNPWERKPLVPRQASRLAELPDYLAFATIITVVLKRPTVDPDALPRDLVREVDAAMQLVNASRSDRESGFGDQVDFARRDLRVAGERLFAILLENENTLRRLTPSEYEHLRMMWREVRMSDRYLGTWRRRSDGLFGGHVEAERLTVASPGEIVFFVTGPLGLAFAIMVVTQWLASRAEHDELDLKNKRIAAEAAEIVLERLKRDNAPISSELVAAVIANARIAPVPLPPLANVKIDVGS